MYPKLALMSLLLTGNAGIAQDLLITNARIIDGTGAVIERGSISTAGKRILSVTQGDSNVKAALEIDASGMTVMPGLMNTHWHLLAGSAADTPEAIKNHVDNVVAGLLESLLDRGITTIMSPGDHFPDILEIRRRLADGALRGPRLLAVGPVFTSPNDWPTQICRGNPGCIPKVTAQVTSPEQAREKVRELAAAGVDAVKLVYDDIIAPGTRIHDDVVAAIAEEATRQGLTLYAHVSTTEETALKVVELGARALVHPPPLRTDASANGPSILRNLGIPVCTTVGLTPDWADFMGREWTEQLEANFRSRLDDLRHLHDGGVTVAFGTDSVADGGPNLQAISAVRFYGEVHALSQIMTNADVIATLTRNAAEYLGLSDELGTLEPGKIADIVLINGNPLARIDDLSKIAVVIQGGAVAVDKR